MNVKQRAAIFEKLKSSGKLKKSLDAQAAMTPKLPSIPKVKLDAVAMPKPPQMPGVPKVTNPMNADESNANFVGKGKQQRFKKLKLMFGI